MSYTDWNVDLFFSVHDLNLVADRHPRRAAHNNPVFCAMMAHLQGQSPALLHDDALDLEPFAMVDRLIRTPRTMDLSNV